MLPFEATVFFQMFAIFTIELFTAMVLLTPKKLKFRWKWYISVPTAFVTIFGGAFLTFFLSTVIPWNSWTNILICVMMTAFCFSGYFLLYPCHFREGLLVAIVAYTIQHMAYQTMVLILDTGLTQRMYESWGADVTSVLYNVFLYTGYVACYVGSYFAICRPYIKNCKYIFRTISIIVLGVSEFLIINAANAIASNSISAWNYQAKAVQAVTLLSFCILLDIIIIGCFELVKKQQQALLMEVNYNMRLESAMKDNDSIAFINMKCHDLRKKIRFIKEHKDMLSDDDLNQIEEALRIYDTGVKTGSRDLDMLIQARSLYCQAKKIEFTSLIDGNVFGDFEANDVFFLFMNIIDNAIEAADKVEDEAKRIVSIKAAKKQGYILITERNYYVGEIETNPDGSLKTHKEDASSHGFGTKSIAYIANKYGGTVHYEAKDGIFELKAVL